MKINNKYYNYRGDAKVVGTDLHGCKIYNIEKDCTGKTVIYKDGIKCLIDGLAFSFGSEVQLTLNEVLDIVKGTKGFAMSGDFKLESKYYTPSIEELYPDIDIHLKGFEEDHVSIDPYTYNDGNNSVNLKKEVSIENFKIKYLDSSDIEELGFELYKIHPGTTTHEFQSKDCRYLITFDPNFNSHWNITISDEEEFTFFHGFIKNKMEFKKLLMQLGIVE